MKKKNKILYLSFDGLTDQVSSSQVVPYIKILNKFFNVFVLTLEKKTNLSKINLQKNKLKDINVNYFFLFFTTRKIFKVIFVIFDFIKIFLYLIYFLKKNKIKIIHARGHMAAFICYFISFFYDINFIFDFRGLWAEERIDSGSLKINSLKGRIIYKLLKNLETKAINKCYSLIVLTNKFKKTILDNQTFKNIKVFVMPCYVEIDKFNKIIKNSNIDIFNELKIPKNSKIITYLGSLGGIYLIKEMLFLFNNINKFKNNYYFLIITNHNKIVMDEINKSVSDDAKKNIIIKNLTHTEVPIYLSQSNFSLFFLKNSVARMAGCPIKFTESLALGIPVICNKNIGDLDIYFNEFKIGMNIDIQNKKEVNYLINNLNYLDNLAKENIKNYASKKFSIKNANHQYKSIYKDLI